MICVLLVCNEVMFIIISLLCLSQYVIDLVAIDDSGFARMSLNFICRHFSSLIIARVYIE